MRRSLRTFAGRLAFVWIAAGLGIAAAQTASEATPDSVAPPDASGTSAPTSQPFTFADRARWVFHSTFGPLPVMTTFIEAGIQTGTDTPPEWGTHWEGFGQRLASKFATTTVRNSLEASIGALWGEDPRYHPLGEGAAGRRIWHALKMTVVADRENGGTAPAYARLIAFPAARVISNEWRPSSQTDARSTEDGVALSFVRRAGSNVFQEFWPDIRRHLPRGK